MSRSEVVLLVEDEPLVLMSAADLLAGAGFEVLTATNIDSAASALEERPETAVVITDINMHEGGNGIDLAWSIAERSPHVRIIIVSGQHRPAREDYPAGALFLTKPYAPGALVTLARDNPDLVQP